MEVKDWLGADNTIGIDIWKRKYRYKNETLDEWFDRVSGGNPELRELISNRKFLFGGRALTNRGTDRRGSMFNCYSSGYAPDDIEGLMTLNSNLALTYKAQGGQGVSLSKIRPKGTPIGNDFESDGIVPFMEIFNTTTASISQGGARKGALMISLDIRHKEAETFIKIKTGADKITKANLSLEIDDKFMNAVQEYYINDKTIVLHERRTYNGHLVEYDIVPIKLYKLMIQTAYDYAEPGCIFTERFRNYNLMELDPDYEIATCNPCGEQPLPKNFSCNLGSINLSEFINDPYTDNASMDWAGLRDAVRIGVDALDGIIDDNLDKHALPQQSKNSKNYRNIGLGIMGYANMLFKLGIEYGSDTAQRYTLKLFSRILLFALHESAMLAIELGKFPKCKPSLITNSEIFSRLKTTIASDIKEYQLLLDETEEMIDSTGLRNCSLLSIAPTGSIATMLGVAGGCEPEFALSYKRRTDNLDDSYDVYCKSVKEYWDVTNNGVAKDISSLPKYFVTSKDIFWKDRINTQSVMQEYIDTAISSTINLAEDIKLEEVEDIYLYAWSRGLKGVTIYRAGCKREGILVEGEDKKDAESEVEKDKYDHIIPTSRKIIGTTSGKTYCKKTACGTLYITINKDSDGNVVESFVNTSKGGICQSNINAINRMISVALRSGVKVEEVVDQLKGITCPACVKVIGKGSKLDGISCPDVIGKTLAEFYKCTDLALPVPKEEVEPVILEEEASCEACGQNKCPDCGAELIHEGGCVTCLSCGWSKCS